MTEANPDMPFPDVGRMLGEMWHNLTHEEKDEYRHGNLSPLTFVLCILHICRLL